MEDTQIIALYLSRQEAAIGETAMAASCRWPLPAGTGSGHRRDGEEIRRLHKSDRLQYPALPGGYGGNRGGYVSGCVECHSTGNSQSAEAFPVPDRPESGL